MKFYLSYWTNKNKEIGSPLSVGNHMNYFGLPKSWTPIGANEIELSNIKKEYDLRLKYKLTQSCVNEIKKRYNEVYFITDYKGEEIFKDLGFTKIFTDLEDLPSEYSEIWCLGKLKSYNIISKIGDPFFHIDYDFVVQRKLPENIINAPILTQSKETRLEILKYCLETINNYLPKKYLYQNIKPNLAYNMGIFGGSDLNFINAYSRSALDVVFDLDNKIFWTTPWNNFPCFTFWSKSTFIEQYYFAVCLEFYNKKSECLIESICPESIDKFQEYNNRKLDCYSKQKILHLHGNMKSDVNALVNIYPGQGYEIFS